MRTGRVGDACPAARNSLRAQALPRDRNGFPIVSLEAQIEPRHLPIVAGRGFEATDVTSPAFVAVVNETLARTVWPGRNPLGQRVRPDLFSAFGGGRSEWHTVVGVARDVKQRVERATAGELYVFAEEHAMAPSTMNVALRTTLPPAALSQTIERMVREVGASVPVVRLRDMDAVFDESIGQPRLLAQILVMFAELALLLAAVGTYGVLSYMTAARRREIGVRIALGAARGRVVLLVMRQGLVLVALGVVHRDRRCARTEPPDCVAAVWRAADRSRDAGCRRDRDYARRGACLLAAGVACVTARSERHPPGRLTYIRIVHTCVTGADTS
jgi:hypothetical protein